MCTSCTCRPLIWETPHGHRESAYLKTTGMRVGWLVPDTSDKDGQTSMHYQMPYSIERNDIGKAEHVIDVYRTRQDAKDTLDRMYRNTCRCTA